MVKKGILKTTRFCAAIMLTGILSASLLSGCSDEWDDQSTSGTVSESQDTTGADGAVGLMSDGEAGVDNGDLTRGEGFEMGTVTSELDENPTRAIRRSTTKISQVLITKLDGTPVPENFYMYRSLLSEQHQRAYDQICQGLTAGTACIEMSVPVLDSDLGEVYFSVLYDHPELFWVGQSYRDNYNNSGYVTKIYPTYYTDDVSGMKSEVEQVVNDALADMWSLGSNIDKVKYAHDYLTNRIDYIRNDMDQSAYSGFVWKQTVCTGYAKCFAYMMHKMGIPCTVVVGSAGGNHAWNMLELDGEYYMMDVTWDDPVGNPENTYYYDYFNITDSQIEKNHSRGNDVQISVYLPAANGTRYSFQNAFGGNAYGTNFDAVSGTMPDTSYVDEGGSSSDDGGYTDGGNDGYVDDSTGSGSDGWWNRLDENWTQADWEYDEDGYWLIWDEETQFVYIYVEENDAFGAMGEDGDEIYWLDEESGEWIAE